MIDQVESYNARFVDPHTVAQTFILRESQFSLLCDQSNSLLVGPRGSGKTTLLKMLKVGAQVAWKNRRQANKLRRFKFAPIYVGADRQFAFVVETTSHDEHSQQSIELLSRSLLALRVKFACVDTAKEITDPSLRDMQNLSHQFVEFTSEQERTLCKLIGQVWDLGEPTLSFLEVKARLFWQLSEINRYLNKIKHKIPVLPIELAEGGQYLTHSPIASCESFVTIFNGVTDRADKQWALCIDELEIMPDHLQHFLFSCFRSIDQKLLLKLATSPFSKIDWGAVETARPGAGHDYTAINLGFTRKGKDAARRNEARRFSAQLLDALIASEGGFGKGGRRPLGTQVLGRSPITEANTSPEQRDSYRAPDGAHYKRFVDLRQKDLAFDQFLRDRNIKLDHLSEEDERRRAGGARKFIWQVACRLEYGPTNKFRRDDQSLGSRSPSRKALADIYLGYDSLLTICEGNPRTTISLMRPLVRRYFGLGKSVPVETQSALLEDAIAKFLSLLSTIRVDDPNGNVSNMSVVDLIYSIGQFFRQEVNGQTFIAEPHLTLNIDRHVPRSFKMAIGLAMNQGAFVMLSDESGLFDFGSLEKARLRLSYLLAPLFHLPLTYGAEVTLSKILLHKRPRTSTRSLTQDDLFGGE